MVRLVRSKKVFFWSQVSSGAFRLGLNISSLVRFLKTKRWWCLLARLVSRRYLLCRKGVQGQRGEMVVTEV